MPNTDIKVQKAGVKLDPNKPIKDLGSVLEFHTIINIDDYAKGLYQIRVSGTESSINHSVVVR